MLPKKPVSFEDLLTVLRREGFEIQSADLFLAELRKKPNVVANESSSVNQELKTGSPRKRSASEGPTKK